MNVFTSGDLLLIKLIEFAQANAPLPSKKAKDFAARLYERAKQKEDFPLENFHTASGSDKHVEEWFISKFARALADRNGKHSHDAFSAKTEGNEVSKMAVQLLGYRDYQDFLGKIGNIRNAYTREKGERILALIGCTAMGGAPTFEFREHFKYLVGKYMAFYATALEVECCFVEIGEDQSIQLKSWHQGILYHYHGEVEVYNIHHAELNARLYIQNKPTPDLLIMSDLMDSAVPNMSVVQAPVEMLGCIITWLSNDPSLGTKSTKLLLHRWEEHQENSSNERLRELLAEEPVRIGGGGLELKQEMQYAIKNFLFRMKNNRKRYTHFLENSFVYVYDSLHTFKSFEKEFFPSPSDTQGQARLYGGNIKNIVGTYHGFYYAAQHKEIYTLVLDVDAIGEVRLSSRSFDYGQGFLKLENKKLYIEVYNMLESPPEPVPFFGLLTGQSAVRKVEVLTLTTSYYATGRELTASSCLFFRSQKTWDELVEQVHSKEASEIEHYDLAEIFFRPRPLHRSFIYKIGEGQWDNLAEFKKFLQKDNEEREEEIRKFIEEYSKSK